MAEASPHYTVVARRYRPQQFADLIGQEHVAHALTNAITSGRVAHAYLFTGGRGMGKTTTARILAKALNCRLGPTPTPCDVCDQCRAVTTGDDVDVIEIDGASHTGVDNIRDLKSNVGFRPQHGRFKIYIIDEVHMLSTAAFNALLKTLEEPPGHVKFILATTDVQKIPATILSRCQRFDFAAIGPAQVFATLKHIAGREGIAADDAALELVARRANGSMRDAQTLLDQLLGSAAGPLTAAGVEALLGTAGPDRVAALATAILGRDPAAALALVGQGTVGGVSPGELIDQLTDYWRGLMLVLVAGPDTPDLPGPPAAHADVRAQAAGTTLDTVLAGIDLLTTARAKLRSSPHAAVLLEVAVVRLARLDELVSVAALVRMLGDGTGPAATVPRPAPPPPQTVAPPKPVGLPEAEKKNAPAGLNGAAHGPPGTAAGAVSPPPAGTSGDITAANLAAVWGRVLDTVGLVRKEQFRLADAPAIIGPNALAVRFPAPYSSAYASCATDATLEILRKVLAKITGKECFVKVELLPATAAVVTTPGANGATGVGSPPAARPPDRAKDLMSRPLFAKAADALGAQLLRIDDGFNPDVVAVIDPGPAPEPAPFGVPAD